MQDDSSYVSISRRSCTYGCTDDTRSLIRALRRSDASLPRPQLPTRPRRRHRHQVSLPTQARPTLASLIMAQCPQTRHRIHHRVRCTSRLPPVLHRLSSLPRPSSSSLLFLLTNTLSTDSLTPTTRLTRKRTITPPLSPLPTATASTPTREPPLCLLAVLPTTAHPRRPHRTSSVPLLRDRLQQATRALLRRTWATVPRPILPAPPLSCRHLLRAPMARRRVTILSLAVRRLSQTHRRPVPTLSQGRTASSCPITPSPRAPRGVARTAATHSRPT